MSREKELGMDRDITRRDFLDGIALGVGSASVLNARASELLAASGSQASGSHYPFPDGNATIARLLVNRLVPFAFPGLGLLDMESVVRAPLAYDGLDRDESSVRIRLRSTAVRVEHEGSADRADWVRVFYDAGGSVNGVRARNVVLACYNAVVPYLMPELPAARKLALAQAAKVPLL